LRILCLVSAATLFGLAGAAPAKADCTCRNRGVEVPEGKTACIQTGQGPQLALCEKNLNVTNWRFLGEGCPTAGRKDEDAYEQTIAVVGQRWLQKRP
jgi:hypothetical protein